MRSLIRLQGVALVAFSLALFSGCEQGTTGTGGGGGSGGSGGGGGGDCGNGELNDGEQCDGAALDDESCTSLGAPYGGDLGCSNSCLYDYSDCAYSPVCGDESADGGEQCDGADLNGETCTSGDYDGGTLACDGNCKYDTSSCTGTGPECGNGNQEGLEDCDGSDLDGESCGSLDYDSGSLDCAADCTFDVSGCESLLPPECGNDEAEPGEDCDGADLGGNTCADIDGFGAGDLACTAGCTFDISACEGESCTDDLRNQDETDVDCGGETCDPCPLGDVCLNHDDCAGDLTCSVGFVCTEHCDDGRLTSDESDIDCGGADCDGCEEGMGCNSPADCAAGLNCGPDDECVDFCADTLQNNDETDVDCGGGDCCPCAVGLSCVDDDDCLGFTRCMGDVCTDSCNDGTMNGNETDIDCGGDICPLCLVDDDCTDDDDCELGLTCNAASLCVDQCNDGVYNGDETAIDCGGGTCKRCDRNNDCIDTFAANCCDEDSDCLSDLCDTNICTLRTNPMTIVELCYLYVNRDNNGDSICTTGHYPSILEWDERDLASECRPGSDAYTWASDVMDSYDQGRITIDWTVAHQCQAMSRYLRANFPNYLLADSSQSPGDQWAQLTNTTDGLCHVFYQPAADLDDPCKEVWDCIEPYYCGAADYHSGATCLVGGVAGEPCGGNTFLECADGFRCVGVLCEVGLPNGGDCYYDGDEGCASGYCDATYTCADEPVYLAIGDVCVSSDQCGGDCLTCRPLMEMGDTECAIPASAGDYCRDDLDCMSGPCLDDTCGSLGRGETCTDDFLYYPSAQCAEGYMCLGTLEAYDFCGQFHQDPDNCLGQATACGAPGACAYDYNYDTCDPGVTWCQPLPKSGPCAGGFVCAQDGNHYCDADAGDRGECRALPVAGEDCYASDGGFYCARGFFCNVDTCEAEVTIEDDPCVLTAPYSCAEPLTCLDQGAGPVCVFTCVATAECATDEVCDYASGLCIPERVQCMSDDECAPDEFCQDPVAACTLLQADATACAAATACTLIPDLCITEPHDCFLYDSAATCDADNLCYWDSYYGDCTNDPALDCGQYEGDSTVCDAADGCVATAMCVDTPNFCRYFAEDATACGSEADCTYLDSLCAEDATYCWQWDYDPTGCAASGMCVYDSYYDYCDPDGIDQCAGFSGDATACNGAGFCELGTDCWAKGQLCPTITDATACTDAGCAYQADLCVPVIVNCQSYDGNETDCLAALVCVYDSTDGFCTPDPAFDPAVCPPHDGLGDCDTVTGCESIARCIPTGAGCFNQDNPTDCGLAAGCIWDPIQAEGLGRCVPHVTTCERLADTGDPCSPAMDGYDCLSGYCSMDDDLIFKCETDIGDGCNNDVEFLRSAFLFGLVFAIGGRTLRRRRKKNKK